MLDRLQRQIAAAKELFSSCEEYATSYSGGHLIFQNGDEKEYGAGVLHLSNVILIKDCEGHSSEPKFANGKIETHEIITQLKAGDVFRFASVHIYLNNEIGVSLSRTHDSKDGMYHIKFQEEIVIPEATGATL